MYEQFVGCAVFLPTNWSSPQTPLLVYPPPQKKKNAERDRERPAVITFLPTDLTVPTLALWGQEDTCPLINPSDLWSRKQQVEKKDVKEAVTEYAVLHKKKSSLKDGFFTGPTCFHAQCGLSRFVFSVEPCVSGESLMD